MHLAQINGEKVVVKVQRPGLKSLFDIDLKNVRRPLQSPFFRSPSPVRALQARSAQHVEVSHKLQPTLSRVPLPQQSARALWNARKLEGLELQG